VILVVDQGNANIAALLEACVALVLADTDRADLTRCARDVAATAMLRVGLGVDAGTIAGDTARLAGALARGA
jgi:hypothetical protein